MKIALVQIALGEKYYSFWERSFFSNKKHFLPNEDVDFFLFTDYKKFSRSKKNLYIKEVEGEKWPFINYLKYIYILEVLNTFKDTYDYIFYLDSDNVFESNVPQDILDKNFVLLRVTSWDVKYAGAFFGGKSKCVEQFCKSISPKIQSIFDGEEFPARENDEALLETIDNAPFIFSTYDFDSVFSWFPHNNEFSEKWISQYDKDFVESHNYNEYKKFNKLEGHCIFDLKRKLVSVLDWKSYSHYGRLIHLQDNKFLIKWENKDFGEDKIEL